MSATLQNWFQPMTFTRLVKTVVNYKVVETLTNYDFHGVIQAFSPQQVSMRPEGQRNWKWFKVHADPGLTLEPDEVITYQGVKYRVMSKLDYSLYGHVEYDLIQDFT